MRYLILTLQQLKRGIFSPHFRCNTNTVFPVWRGLTIQSLRWMSQSENNRINYLSNLFGISKSQATKLINQNQVLRQLNESRLDRIFKILQEMKIDNKQVFHAPQIFNYLPSTLDERSKCLKELGFQNITVSNLLKFNTLLRCTPRSLKRRKLLPNDVEPLKEMLKQTHDPDHFLDIIGKDHLDLSQYSLGRIRHLVLVEFLSSILRVSTNECKIILEKYPSLRNRSLKSIKKTYSVLTRDLEFSVMKVLSHVHLLNKPVEEIEGKLNEFILLAGVGFKYLASKHPNLLNITSQQLRAILKLLSNYDVTNEQIINCSKLLLLPPGTIRKRFENLKTVPGFDKYRSHSSFLELVCCKPQEIPEWIKKIENDNDSLNHSSFRHVEYFYSGTKHMEVILYVTDYLGLPLTVVQEKLQSYPRWIWANLLNTSQVLSLLKRKGLNKEQITLALPIVLYKESVVEKYLDKIAGGNLEKELSNPLVLRNVLNAMEEENFLSDVNVIEYHSEKLNSKNKLVSFNKNFLTKLFSKYYTTEKRE